MGMIANRRRIVAAQPHLVTASGETLGIAVAEPKLNKLAVTFAPVQSGSGTPSPSNVRPISGWTDIAVRMCGKNLFDNQFPNIDSTNRYRPVYVGNSTVTVSTTCGTTPAGYTLLYVLPGNVSSGADSSANGLHSGITRTVQPVNGYITIGYRISAGVDPSLYTTQVEYGTTATTIEPYRGITPSISLGGTYYGGTVDLVSGVMTVTMAYEVFTWGTGYTQSVDAGNYIQRRYILQYKVKNSTNVQGNTICDTLTWDFSWGKHSLHFYTDRDGDVSRVHFAMPMDTPDSTQIGVCYDLYDPFTITLTPQTIAAMRGQQTVTSPAGSVEISYWTH